MAFYFLSLPPILQAQIPVILTGIFPYLINKPRGNWHEETARVAATHQHGADLILVSSKRNREYFIIKYKGKSYAKSAVSIKKGASDRFLPLRRI